MKTIYLVRHAKSSWKYQQLADIDRPLKQRGVKAAYAMAEALKTKSGTPDLIISSPAARALNTAVIFSRILSYPMEKIIIDERIYEAGTRQLLQVIRETAEEQDSIMLFGHNPSLSELIGLLTKKNRDLPTCGVAGISFSIDRWKDIEEGNGDPICFLTPKTLHGEKEENLS